MQKERKYTSRLNIYRHAKLNCRPYLCFIFMYGLVICRNIHLSDIWCQTEMYTCYANITKAVIIIIYAQICIIIIISYVQFMHSVCKNTQQGDTGQYTGMRTCILWIPGICKYIQSFCRNRQNTSVICYWASISCDNDHDAMYMHILVNLK